MTAIKDELLATATALFEAVEKNRDNSSTNSILKLTAIEQMKPDDLRFNMALRVFVIHLAIPFFEGAITSQKRMSAQQSADHDELYKNRKQTILTQGVAALEKLYNGQKQSNPKILNLDEEFLAKIERGLLQIPEWAKAGYPAVASIHGILGNTTKMNHGELDAAFSHFDMHERFLQRIGLLPGDKEILANGPKRSGMDDIKAEIEGFEKLGEAERRLEERFKKDPRIAIVLDEFTDDPEFNAAIASAFMIEIMPYLFLTKHEDTVELNKSFGKASSGTTAIYDTLTVLQEAFDGFVATGLKTNNAYQLAQFVGEEIKKAPLLKSAIVLASCLAVLVIQHQKELEGEEFDTKAFQTEVLPLLPPETNFDFGAPDNRL